MFRNHQNETYKKGNNIKSREQQFNQSQNVDNKTFPRNVLKKRNWKSTDHLTTNKTLVNSRQTNEMPNEMNKYPQEFTVGKNETKNKLKKNQSKMTEKENEQNYGKNITVVEHQEESFAKMKKGYIKVIENSEIKHDPTIEIKEFAEEDTEEIIEVDTDIEMNETSSNAISGNYIDTK
jgi:hypothetical protein